MNEKSNVLKDVMALYVKVLKPLGPASSSEEIIRQMINEGVDVFRLNFSHSTQDEHLKLIKNSNKTDLMYHQTSNLPNY